MIKTLNNDLKNAIKNRRLFLTEAMAKDSDFNIKNYLPDIQKQIKLEKLKFESNTNFPLITGNSTSTQKSKKSIFNHLTEIENINKNKVDKIYNKEILNERKPIKTIVNLLSLSDSNSKLAFENNSTDLKTKKNLESANNYINSAKIKLEKIMKNQRFVAKSTKSIFPKSNPLSMDEEKIMIMNQFKNKNLLKKAKTNTENNYIKNQDALTKPQNIPSFAYLKKYESTVFTPILQINDYNYQKEFHINPPENSRYNFVTKNKNVTKSNILLSLIKSEQNKLEINYNFNSDKIAKNKKILEKDEINFEKLKESQKNLTKKFEIMYSNISEKNKELIYEELENRGIIKITQDEIRRILHKIDKLCSYGYFINEVLGGDIKRFEKKIIPEDKYDDEINYDNLTKEVLLKYNYLIPNTLIDDKNLIDAINHEKTFIYEPEKMWFKYKEIEDLIVRNVFTKENIKNEIKRMINEKNYNLKDLRQRKILLENEYFKTQENYEYEKIKYNEISKRYNSHKNEFDEMVKNLYLYSKENFNKICNSQINFNLADTLDITKEIYNIIYSIEIYLDKLVFNLKKYQTEDNQLFEEILNNRKKYIKIVKQQQILNQKLKDKFDFISNIDISNKIIFKSRKTEAPYHKPKKVQKEEIDKSLLEKLENQEMLTYEREDDDN